MFSEGEVVTVLDAYGIPCYTGTFVIRKDAQYAIVLKTNEFGSVERTEVIMNIRRGRI